MSAALSSTLDQALDLGLGLITVLFESGLQFGRLGGLGHFRQGRQNLALGVVDVAKRIVKQGVERLLGHDGPLQRLQGRPLQQERLA